MKIDLDSVPKLVLSLTVDDLETLHLKLSQALALVIVALEITPKKHLRLVRKEEYYDDEDAYQLDSGPMKTLEEE